MPQFFPPIEHTNFQSAAELKLYRLLAHLDDNYTVIHSLPWLRHSMERIYSPELKEHIGLYAHTKKNVTGEIDFVLCHPQYGMLCVEAKGGEYVLEGAQFVHKKEGYVIDPLGQVKNNAFTMLETLREKDINIPVGYCIYFPDTDLDTKNLPLAYKPAKLDALEDGILILSQHELDIARRIETLFQFWFSALRPSQPVRDYTNQIAKFLQAVWPIELRDNSVGRAIAYDKNIWLRLDKKQSEVVYQCLTAQSGLVTGFSGTGKTLIAISIAIAQAKSGIRTLILFKNRKIATHVQLQLENEKLATPVDVSTYHAFCQSIGKKVASADLEENGNDYDKYFTYLVGQRNSTYGSVLVDEAQGLNESDHIALEDYFKGCKQYIFADEYQTLPLEKGTTYARLEQIYGIPAYNLSIVYRNPHRVTEEIQKIINVRQQIFNARNDRRGDFEYERLLSWDVANTIKRKVAELIEQGATINDIVILSGMYLDSLEVDPAIATSTIAAFRGMEVPIAIIVPDSKTDDRTLACAIGRCTTKAIVIVNVHLLSRRNRRIPSDYIESAYDDKWDEILRFDREKKHPAFIENIIERVGERRATHRAGNADFAYFPLWKAWAATCDGIPDMQAVLWGIFLQDFTQAYVRQIHLEENRFGYDRRIEYCEECQLQTPHDYFSKCYVCSEGTPNEDLVNMVPQLANGAKPLVVKGSQSILNAFAVMKNTLVSDLAVKEIGVVSRDDMIFLSTILIMHYISSSGAVSCTKDDIRTWITSSVLAEEFDVTDDRMVSSAISSMCSRKMMRRTGKGRYTLISAEVET